MASILGLKFGASEPPRQMLPKDLLVHARQLSQEETDKQIASAIQQHKILTVPTIYGNPNAFIGATSSAIGLSSINHVTTSSITIPRAIHLRPGERYMMLDNNGTPITIHAP